MSAAKAASSDRFAQQGAEQLLADGGNATDAVVAGFLAAAAADAGVLLSPVTALVAGVGAGARCFDGRCCQPGSGSRRPRGYLPQDEIPQTARVATPRALATIALLHAYGASRPMSAVTKPAIAIAKKQGAAGRAALLAAVAQHGAAALRSAEALRALLRAGGPPAGGLLSEHDLREARPHDLEPEQTSLAAAVTVATPPWAEPPEQDGGRRSEVVVAADPRGVVAALAFSPDDGGVPVPELELRLARDAEPVRRAVSRVTPGTAMPAALPIAIAHGLTDNWFAAIGVCGGAQLDIAALGKLADRQGDGGMQLTAMLDALAGAKGVAHAASVQRGKASLSCVER